MRRASFVAAGLAAAALALIFACSGSSETSDWCATPYACTNAPFISQSQIDSCHVLTGDPACGGLYSDYLQCRHYKITCNPNGTPNEAAATVACATENSNYLSCRRTDGGPLDGCRPSCGSYN